ncbi:PTS glucose transporter subunit IIA [uncultured Ilyobacter sp.]|uniref:PTS sugar transporter subunit IIA n=1 Tax=uncultured Ilyobacter sp. TaxID=544433 RepID=UPI0029C77DFC|nr:PTS glucose transporter subunit IIA [uncultured Ilyobacter sp.]
MGILGLLKKNRKNCGYVKVYSPMNGKVISLEAVPDDAFSKKMLGDGCAIDPSQGSVFAPVEGEVDIFDTNHAITFEMENGLEMIVHLGIDTVELDGSGFDRIGEPGSLVSIGEELVRYDLDYIRKNAKSAISPVIITSMDDIESIEVLATGEVRAGDLLMKVKMKKNGSIPNLV